MVFQCQDREIQNKRLFGVMLDKSIEDYRKMRDAFDKSNQSKVCDMLGEVNTTYMYVTV